MQRYVKGLISQNQRHTDFLDRLSRLNSTSQILRQIEDFRSELANGATVGTQDGGESTENEEEGRGSA